QAGDAYETDADHGACARPFIGEHVPTVGAQGQRAVSATGADQVASEGEVGERGAEHDENAQTDLAHLGSLDEAAEGAVDDEDGSEGDEPALERRGEELDLAVPVGMIAIGGTTSEDEAAQGEDGPAPVDARFERLREDGPRPGPPLS